MCDGRIRSMRTFARLHDGMFRFHTMHGVMRAGLCNADCSACRGALIKDAPADDTCVVRVKLRVAC